MNYINRNNIILAIQKNGKLTEETLEFLRKSGLNVGYNSRKLFSTCDNFPLQILYVRDDDIPNYVENGIADIGILGQNLLFEIRPKVKKLLNLRFGYCSMIIAIPKDSPIKRIEELQNKTIATTYPKSTNAFFSKRNISINIVKISGSVEITPSLGIASAIVDLTATGSTLAMNDLKSLAKVYDSEAILITNQQTLENNKKDLLNKLIVRFKGVLSAKNYKYINMNIPKNALIKFKKITPGIKFSTITPLFKEGWISIQTIIKEDIFWETIDKIKQIGASEIVISPIEKIIN